MPSRRGLFGKGLGLGGAAVGGWLASKTPPAPQPPVEVKPVLSPADVRGIVQEMLDLRDKVTIEMPSPYPVYEPSINSYRGFYGSRAMLMASFSDYYFSNIVATLPGSVDGKGDQIQILEVPKLSGPV